MCSVVDRTGAEAACREEDAADALLRFAGALEMSGHRRVGRCVRARVHAPDQRLRLDIVDPTIEEPLIGLEEALAKVSLAPRSERTVRQRDADLIALPDIA